MPAAGVAPGQSAAPSVGQSVPVTAERIKETVGEAIKHAREAEDAGQQGKAEALVTHARMALNKAKDAQGAGHNERLNEGVYALGEAIEHGKKGQAKDATEHMMHAIMKLSQAAGLQMPGEEGKATSPGSGS